MNIPAPPLYAKGAANCADDEGSAADGRGADASPAYYGYFSQKSNGSDASAVAAHFDQPAPAAAQSPQRDQHQLMGQQYYDYYTASQAAHEPQKSYQEHTGEGRVDTNALAYGASPSPRPVAVDSGNSDGAPLVESVHSFAPSSSALSSAPSSTSPYAVREQYSYYGNKTIYDPSYDQQYAQQIEERHDQSYQERLDQTFEDSFLEEAAPATPSSAAKQKLLPSVFALAQKLLPTVMRRLDKHDNMRIESQYDDGFEGLCSPLGSPTPSPKKSVASPSPSLNASLHTPDKNLKTTGLEESDYIDAGYYESEEEHVDALEAGDAMPNEEEMREYLPQSAALLVSALQGSAKKVENYESKERMSFDHLPTLVDDISAAEFFGGGPGNERSSEGKDKSGFAGFSPIKRLDSMEREADALLDSIRNDDIGSGGSSGNILRRRSSPSNRSLEDSQDDDDEGSISGDVARLTQSIAHLQRDLENVDFSNMHDDGFGGVGFDLGEYDGESGLLGRMKLWFSRGMIMEQKLLHTYVNPMDGASGDQGGTTTQTAGRYTDNPVLVWSLALMWAFVALILMNPKIAELVEGGDPGQLADIIEWLFG